MKTKMWMLLLALAPLSSQAARYCRAEEAEIGEFQGRVVPVSIPGRCLVPNAQNITLGELKGLIQKQISADAKIHEGPTSVQSAGLRGERYVFEYLDLGRQDEVPGTYELIILEDGKGFVQGRIRSIELRGKGLLANLKNMQVDLNGTMGSALRVDANVQVRVQKPAWAGTRSLFRGAIEGFLPGMMERVLGDIEKEIEKLR